jgi:AcrR family transcriptional regulator
MIGQADHADVTRQELIDAGIRLCERATLADLNVAMITAEAGTAEGTFFRYFPDRGAFLVALHQTVYDRTLDSIIAEAGALTPGRARLLQGSNAYLDEFLRQRSVRALLLEARVESMVALAVPERNEQLSELIHPDLAAMGWSHPRAAARLWIGLVVEAAMVELRAGRRLPDVRAALAQFLQPHRSLTAQTT